MKRRRKLNFWELLPKIAPWIMAFMFWKYSNLNARETGIIIAASVVFYVLIMLATDAWIETEGRD